MNNNTSGLDYETFYRILNYDCIKKAKKSKKEQKIIPFYYKTINCLLSIGFLELDLLRYTEEKKLKLVREYFYSAKDFFEKINKNHN